MIDPTIIGAELAAMVKAKIDPLLDRMTDLENRLNDLPVPKDGKDADPAQVATLVRDEMKGDLEDIRATVASFPALVAAPELPDIPKMIDDAIEAKMGVEDIERSIEEVVRMVVAGIPVPKDGKDGLDGRDGTSVLIEDVLPTVKSHVDDYLATIELPKDGRDGLDGKGVTIEDVMTALQKHVDDFLSAIPMPENGKDGRDGVDGNDGAPGDPGRDGLDVKDLFRAEGGILVATMSDGRVKELGRFVGKDGDKGNPGKDGVDGVGFDDLFVEYDGEKCFTMKFTKGDRVKEFAFSLPVVIDRGIFSQGKTYQAGDGVTWAGHYWIAQKDTDAKPGEGDGWRLAVKRGRDGKTFTVKVGDEKKQSIPLKKDNGGEDNA